MSLRIPIDRGKLGEFCRRHRVRELGLFGSVLGDEFGPDSDVDVLVTFAADVHYSLYDLADMREELKSILGREVDLVEKPALRNPFRRRAILGSLEVVYAAQ